MPLGKELCICSRCLNIAISIVLAIIFQRAPSHKRLQKWNIKINCYLVFPPFLEKEITIFGSKPQMPFQFMNFPMSYKTRNHKRNRRLLSCFIFYLQNLERNVQQHVTEYICIDFVSFVSSNRSYSPSGSRRTAHTSEVALGYICLLFSQEPAVENPQILSQISE